MTRPGIHKSLEAMQALRVSVIFAEIIHAIHSAQMQLQSTVGFRPDPRAIALGLASPD